MRIADGVITIPEDTPGLPLGVSVELETRHGVTQVTIIARLHVNTHFKLPHSYSAEHWTSARILRDHDFLKYLSRYR